MADEGAEGVTERPGTLLDGAVLFHQPETGYRAAIDPVLLAAACPAEGVTLAADLGCGAGAASLCLAHRCPSPRIAAIDRDAAILAYARKNAAANGLEERVRPVEADIRSVSPGALGGPAGLVLANPPFLEPGKFTEPPDPARAAAHAEGDTPLAEWIAAARRLSAPGAALVVIHRADRLADLLACLKPAYGGIEIVPLWPKAGQPAKRVIVRARLGSRAPLSLTAGLVLHETGGAFTAAAQEVLRGGGALAI